MDRASSDPKLPLQPPPIRGCRGSLGGEGERPGGVWVRSSAENTSLPYLHPLPLVLSSLAGLLLAPGAVGILPHTQICLDIHLGSSPTKSPGAAAQPSSLNS